MIDLKINISHLEVMELNESFSDDEWDPSDCEETEESIQGLEEVSEEEQDIPTTTRTRKRKHKYYELPETWTKTEPQFKWGEFSGLPPGVRNDSGINNNSTPFEIFRKVWTEEMINDIVKHTNSFANKMVESGKLRVLWTNTTVSEIHLFICGLLFCGIVRLPVWNHYFTNDPSLGQPFIQEMFSRQRWNLLLTMIHIEDPDNFEADNPLWRVSTVTEAINKNIKKLWNPGEILVVDEGMIPFNGRTRLRQYIPRKPHSNGIKYWALVDNYGFLYSFDIYAGKKAMKGATKTSLGLKVVLMFEQQVPRGNYLFITDSYFTSISLMDRLSERNRRCLTTARTDRTAIMKALASTHESWGKGTVEWASNCEDDAIVALVWKDSALVGYFTNCFSPTDPPVTRNLRSRWNTSVVRTTILPRLCSVYRDWYHMVDVFNNCQVSHTPHHRTARWTFACFLAFIKFGVVNSWRIYQQYDRERVSQSTFIIMLFNEIKSSYFTSIKEQHDTNHLSHFPVKGSRKYCVHCKNKSTTHFSCSGCKVPLHTLCFQPYHSSLIE
jgi:hypothetical protein